VSRESLAAKADALCRHARAGEPTGGVVVAADTTEVSAGSSALPTFACPARGADRRLDAVRIHQDPRHTP
jgi:hypothetical protein